MFAHILMPTNGTDHSERAIKRGIELAKLCGAKVTGIHVMQDYRLLISAEGAYDPGLHGEIDTEARLRAESFLASVQSAAVAADVPCETVIRALTRMLLRRLQTVLSALVVTTGLMCAVPALAQGWMPQRHVELVVPQGAGGSLDTTARTLQRLWTEMKLVPVSSAVVNRAGGEHAIAYNFIRQKTGDPHSLSLAVPVIFSNQISGVSAFNHRDITPVALLTTEYYLFVVSSGSQLRTGRDFVEALKKNPASLSVGITSVLQRIAAGLVLQSENVNVRQVRMAVFTGGQTTAVAGGHVDVAITSLAQALPHIEGGSLRAIAVGSPKRMLGLLAAAPTWGELGYRQDACQTWRAVIAPRNITPAQLAYWEGVLKRVTDTEEFRVVAEKQRWEVTFKSAAEVQRMMDAEYDEMKSVMSYLGLAK